MPFAILMPTPSRRFVAPPNTDYRDIHAAADDQLATMQDGVVDALDALTDGIDPSALDAAAGQPTATSVRDLIDWAAFGEALGTLATDVFRTIVPQAATATATHLYRQLSVLGMLGGRGQPPSGVPTGAPGADPLGAFVGRFDLLNPKAVDWIDTRASALVQQVTDETRLAIQTIIKRSFVDGIAPRDTARLLRSVIGLTERQAGAVYNYERWLRGQGAGPLGSLSQGDIQRLLRGGLRRNQLAGLQWNGLSEERISKLVEGYRQRLINERAETIARTETMAASNHGQLALWQDAQGQGLLTDGARKKWINTPDMRTCIVCASAAGQTVPLDQAFESMNGPVMVPADSHPRCRCAMVVLDGGNR